MDAVLRCGDCPDEEEHICISHCAECFYQGSVGNFPCERQLEEDKLISRAILDEPKKRN